MKNVSEREWKQYPSDIPVETAFGTIFLSVTSADHVYADGSGNGKSLTVRGKQYSFSAHLHLAAGKWAVGTDRSSVYARKHMCFDRDDAMPPSYQAKVVAEIEARVNAHLAAHPELVLDGAVADASNNLGRAEKELAELQAKVAEKEAEVSALRLKYLYASGQVGNVDSIRVGHTS